MPIIRDRLYTPMVVILRWKTATFIVLFICIAVAVPGQVIPDTTLTEAAETGSIPQQNDTLKEPQRVITRTLDSILLLSFESSYRHYFALDGSMFMDNSLLYIHRFDPAYREGNIDRIGTGNLGDPMYELIPALPSEPGLRIGPEVYRYLLMNRNNRHIINTSEHFTKVAFVQGTNNAEIMLEADYAHTFSRNFNLTLNYRRINHEGLYSFQKNRHTQLSLAGFKQFSDRYYLSFFAIGNDIKTQNNGGILADSLLYVPGAERRRNVPVHLTEGRTMAGTAQYGVRHFLESARPGGITWIAEQVYHNHKFHYYDNAPPEDGLFYGVFAVNPIGIRHFLQHRAVEHSGGALGRLGAFSGNLRLRHRWHIVDVETDREHFHSLDIVGNATLHADSLFYWQLGAETGQTGAEFTWKLSSQIHWMPFESLQIYASAEAMRYLPSLMDKKLVISFEELYHHNFGPVTGIVVSGGMRWLPVGLAAEARLFQAVNYIYNNADGLPQQADFVTVPGLSLIFDRSLGPVHTSHRLSIQYGAEGVYPLPLWYSLHCLALEGMIFKRAMLARTGFDLRLSDRWETPVYMPVTGSYIPGSQSIDIYPQLDFYFSFRVERFTAFAKFENVLDLILEPVPYEIATYPLRDFSFRFGINWQFSD